MTARAASRQQLYVHDDIVHLISIFYVCMAVVYHQWRRLPIYERRRRRKKRGSAAKAQAERMAEADRRGGSAGPIVDHRAQVKSRRLDG